MASVYSFVSKEKQKEKQQHDRSVETPQIGTAIEENKKKVCKYLKSGYTQYKNENVDSDGCGFAGYRANNNVSCIH